jgi:hypothetical protein
MFDAPSSLHFFVEWVSSAATSAKFEMASAKSPTNEARHLLLQLARTPTPEAMASLRQMAHECNIENGKNVSKVTIVFHLSEQMDVLVPNSAVKVAEPPLRFLDPHTHKIMRNPAAASDGYIYDARTLEALEQPVSPITDMGLLPTAYLLVGLRREVTDWMVENGHPGVEELGLEIDGDSDGTHSIVRVAIAFGYGTSSSSSGTGAAADGAGGGARPAPTEKELLETLTPLINIYRFVTENQSSFVHGNKQQQHGGHH